MAQKELETPFTERRVVRRGLVAGVAALAGAAMLKLAGADRASAANGDPLLIGNTATPGGPQTASATTSLIVDPPAGDPDAPALIVQRSTSSGFAGRYAIVASNNNLQAAIWARQIGSGPGILVTSQSQASLQAIASANLGIAVLGVSNDGGIPGSTTGTGAGIGVQGRSGTGTGVWGSTPSGVGVKGTSSAFVGVVGISDWSIGLYGFNAAGNVPALYSENLAASNRLAAVFNGDVRVQGNFTVVGGAKAAGVLMPDGSEATMYCQESPEAYFEDFGRAQLTGGSARVALEQEFASIVRRDDYMVFLTPGGDCNGLFIGRSDAQGFEVRELKGGTSTLPFSYRVVARRRDNVGKRLQRQDPQVAKNVAELQKTLAKVRPTAEQRGAPGGEPGLR